MTAPLHATALLVMDVQRGITERFDDDDDDDDVAGGAGVARMAQAVAAAREAGVRVIFVRVAFRADHPEISSRNRTFSALREAGGLLDHSAATEIDPRVAPLATEFVVTKRRVSAFSGSDLDVVLRAGDTHALVLCGIATSGVVLSTVRAAADLDYELTVLADACLDSDPEVHRVLTEKVFPGQAHVLDVAAWTARLAGA
jgi:nicotinamidase-related amidase